LPKRRRQTPRLATGEAHEVLTLAPTPRIAALLTGAMMSLAEIARSHTKAEK